MASLQTDLWLPVCLPVFCHFVSKCLLFNLLTGSLQKWDSSLKVIAEGYAAKCVWNHNPELEDTGENLFAGTGPLDLREALEKWFLGESVPRGAGAVKCVDLSFSSKRQTEKLGKFLLENLEPSDDEPVSFQKSWWRNKTELKADSSAEHKHESR